MTDRIQLQILWNRILALVEEQAQILKRTAFSPVVRDCGDLSVGLFDVQGRMIAQAVTGTPGHVNAMAESVGHFLRHFVPESMREGDSYITNDPWMGTGHLNDLVLMTPYFFKGKLTGYFCCTCHVTDIGGMPSGAGATDVFAEGLSIPMLKLTERGVMNESLLAIINANSRLPTDAIGDVYSLAACNEAGIARLNEFFAEFSLCSLDELANYIVDTSHTAVKRAIETLPKGTWRYEMLLDGYADPITLAASVTIANDRILVDFAGTSSCVSKGINVPRSYASAYAVFGLACAVAAGVPNNSGSLSAFELRIPEGCILNAARPAPVAARHVVGQMLPDLIFGCLGQVIPERVPAEGASCIWNVSCRGTRWSSSGRGEPFALALMTNGGTGARATLDGLSATAFPSGVQATSVEIFETRTPLTVWRKELRTDSGGAGVTRGGLGQHIEISSRDDKEFFVNASFDRIRFPARGRNGGEAGSAGYIGLASGAVLQGKGLQAIPSGETLVIQTPGGGGIGRPAERDVRRIAEDLEQGYVSQAAAEAIYQLGRAASSAGDQVLNDQSWPATKPSSLDAPSI